MSAGQLPCNPWAPCGDLLCDAAAVESDAVMDLLAAAATELPWPLVWCDDTAPEAPRWRALLTGVRSGGHFGPRPRAATRRPAGNWRGLERLPKATGEEPSPGNESGTHRLANEGNLQFEMSAKLEPESVEPWLREAFEVENLSWKGESGTSVLRTPGMFEILRHAGPATRRLGPTRNRRPASGRPNVGVHVRLPRQASELRPQNRLRSPFFRHSPGQLLFYHILERFHGDGETRALDFMGPMTQSISRWRPATYGVGRVAIAPRRLLGRAAMTVYKRLAAVAAMANRRRHKLAVRSPFGRGLG